MVLLGVSVADRKPPRDLVAACADAVRRILADAGTFWSRLSASVPGFVGATTFIASVTWVLTATPDRAPGPWAALATVAVLSCAALHYAVYYTHGMVRWALFGGLTCWLVASPVMMINFWARNQESPALFVQMFVIGLVAFMLVSIHTVFGSIAAVLGGYSRMRRAESLEQNLTRQQLLERLFEVQKRLENASDLPDRPAGLAGWPAVQAFQRHPYLYSGLIGLLFGWLGMGLVALATGGRFDPVALQAPLVLGISLFVNLATILFVAAIGFFAGGLRRGIAANLIFYSGTVAPGYLLVALGVDLAEEMISISSLLIIAIFVVVISAFASMGARVEERAARDHRLRHSDKRTLLAEKVRLEWLLSPRAARTVCVMVVDAAKSSLMKAREPDPYVVEWTFREYQRFIEQVAARHAGTVHSTAGDGAVVAFHRARDAFAAARQIQSEVSEFNRTVNRLKLPFRLRIGLHQGEIVGELSKVEYTAVIDIAAHIEGVAPVGGIALTEAVARDLEGEPLAELKDAVDGYHVYVALNPTLSGS